MKLTKEQLQYFTEKYLPLLPPNSGGDTELDHIKADEILVEILLELGLKKIVEAYSEIGKWYS